MIWTVHSAYRPEVLGLLPEFLSPADERDVRTQLHENYAHGGGWQPFEGFELQRNLATHTGSHEAVEDPMAFTLQYPEDPPVRALAYTTLRDETIILFQWSWVVVIGPWGWEVARMD